MIKYTIPMILTSIVLAAGIFAFMPVGQASTVHTTILATAMNLECETTVNADVSDTTVITVSADDDFVLQALYMEFVGADGNENTDFPTFTVIAGQGGEANTLALGDLGVDPAAGDFAFELLRMNDDITAGTTHKSLAGAAIDTLTIDFEMTAGTEDDNESLTVTACALINEGDAASLTVGITA